MRYDGRQPRGLALVMVLAVIAIVTIMGLCLLSSASLQAQVAFNATQTINVEPLAESGLELAAYYLFFPRRAPQRANGYWPGQAGLTINGLPGSVDVTVTGVTKDANNNYTVYDVASTARATTPAGTVRHTATARLQLTWGFGLEEGQAAAFGGSITLANRMTVIGNVHSNQTLTIDAGSSVQGTARAGALVNTGGSVTSSVLLGPDDALTVPSTATIKDYATYTYASNTGHAQPMPGVPDLVVTQNVSLSNITLGPATPNNLGGVYIVNGNLTLASNVQINGTVIVRNGRLIVLGSGNTITPQAGLPALVVAGDLQMTNRNHALTVNGLTYLGTGVTHSGDTSGCQLTVNGALILGNTAQLDGNYSPGNLTVQYDASRLKVPDFSATAMQIPLALKITAWKP